LLDTRLDQINFADPALYEHDVEAIWAHLRRHQPVYLNALALDPFWLVTRYEDAVRVFKDHATFTSAKGSH
jgi:cytochrome P450